MEGSAFTLISEIGPQHHLVVNEEGIVQFTDDGNELLVYDDLTASIVGVASCPISWNHFGLELQPNNSVTSNLATVTSNSNLEVKEEIEIKSEITDNGVNKNITTFPKYGLGETNNMFTDFNQSIDQNTEFKQIIDQNSEFKQRIDQNDSSLIAFDFNQNNMQKETSSIAYQKETPKPARKMQYNNTLRLTSSEIFKEHFLVKKFTPEEQIMEFEKRKENRQKFLERLYKCQTCYRGFQLQENYAKHMLCHMVKTKYHCPICRLYLETKSIFHSHMNQHKQKFTCKHCSFESYHRASSTLHARAHAIDLPQSYQTFMKHQKNKHFSNFVCGMCGFSFVNEVGLKLHERRTHRDSNGIPVDGPTCTKCEVVFANEQAFIMHCRISHNGYETPTPSVMTEILTQPSSPSINHSASLQSGYAVPDSTVTLQNDGLESSQLCSRYDDVEKDLVPSFLCYLCGATFSKDEHLESHMNGHHDDERRDYNKDYKMEDTQEGPNYLLCEFCQRTFLDPILLYRHVHSHKYAIRLKQQSRRPECPQCGMTFSTFSNRLRHIKYAHTEIRPSICDVCHKGFKSEPELKSHVDHVHLKKPWPKRNRGRDGRELSPY